VSEDAPTIRDAQPAEDASTPTIPGYRLLERLGRGAAGVVYLAEADDDLARRFAVKVFPPDAAAHYARELATLREVEEVRRGTGSRDLLEVVHAGDAHGQPFVVMEYCPGGDLLSRVRSEGPLPSDEALRLLIPVVRALELLHAHGWVHKDVKPANVLIGGDGLPRLGDFGLTRTLEGPLSSAGTPGFCAPELYKQGAAESGALLDVYSAAATLYFVLSGDAPLPGRPDVFPLERQRVPRALQRVLLAALRVDPAQRLGSAAELRELLEGVQRGESVLDPRGLRWPRYVAGALVVLALALTGGWWLNRERPQALPVAGAPELDLRWSARGELWHGADPPLAVLDGPPISTVTDPLHTTLAAVSRNGAVAVVGLDPPRVVARIAPPAQAPTVVAAAIHGTFLARLWAAKEGPPRLELYALPSGARLASCEAQGVGDALAVTTTPAGHPRVVIGTLSGDLVIQGFDGPGLRVRSHGDSIRSLWIDSAEAVLHVLGDDREFSPEAGADEVQLEDGRGLGARPQLVTRSWDLPALLEGRARLVDEASGGER